MPKIQVNDSGVIRTLNKVQVNDAGVIRTLNKVQVNDSGVIRTIYQPQTQFNIVITGYSDTGNYFLVHYVISISGVIHSNGEIGSDGSGVPDHVSIPMSPGLHVRITGFADFDDDRMSIDWPGGGYNEESNFDFSFEMPKADAAVEFRFWTK